MKPTGSRTTGTSDIFSDWDFHVDSQDDFAVIADKIADAAVWNIVKRGSLYVATIIDVDGVMWDYSGRDEPFGEAWEQLGVPEADVRPIYDYWIIAFKHLKGLHRGFEQLASVGVEMSTGLARDIYLARKYDIKNYKNFFAYKQLAPIMEPDDQLKSVMGLPYRTGLEMRDKLFALNQIVLDVSPDISQQASDAFQTMAQHLDLKSTDS